MAFIVRKSEYRETRVCRGTTIGANATIICGVKLGEYCLIGAGAVVNRDVQPYALMVGVPARQIGWVTEEGERIDLPVSGKGEWKCKKTETLYKLEGTKIEKLKTEAS